MTRLAGLDDKSAGTDAFGLTNYDKLQADIDYLVVAGADLASAATLDITSEFHGVTGTTTIDDLTDPDGAAPGQQVKLWIKDGPLTIRNNGGGTGNIRTASGSDRVCAPNEIVALVYDGADWRELAPMSGTRVAYGVKASNVTTTGTTFATGADVLAAALDFVADGVSDYIAKLSAPAVNAGGGNSYAYLNLDGAQSSLAENDAVGTTAPSPIGDASVLIAAPAAGAHTVNFRLVVNSGTGTLYAPILVTVERA